MEPEKKAVLKKYITCFCVAAVITVLVFWIKGFFTDNAAANIQLLSDGFVVSGLLLTMFSAMIFISDEGGFLGLTFVARGLVQMFIPTGRRTHESYKEYRERKLGKTREPGNGSILITGLLFLLIGVVFTIIWYVKFRGV